MSLCIVHDAKDNITGSGIQLQVIKNMLRDMGYFVTEDWEGAVHDKIFPKFIFYEGTVPKGIHEVPCEFKNHLNGHQCITNKIRFHTESPPEIMKYLSPSVLYKPGVRVPSFPVIIRPEYAWSGRGISVVDNADELAAAIKKAIRETRWDAKIIISKYKERVLLFHGKKFHCRLYAAVSYIHGEKAYDIFDEIYIYTSRGQYDPKSRSDEQYDTHLKGNDRDMYQDALLDIMSQERLDDLITQMRHMFGEVLAYGIRHLHPYYESANGYDILAADVLILDDYTPMIMEINDYVGFNRVTYEDKNAFSVRYFNWLRRTIYSKILYLKCQNDYI